MLTQHGPRPHLQAGSGTGGGARRSNSLTQTRGISRRLPESANAKAATARAATPPTSAAIPSPVSSSRLQRFTAAPQSAATMAAAAQAAQAHQQLREARLSWPSYAATASASRGPPSSRTSSSGRQTRPPGKKGQRANSSSSTLGSTSRPATQELTDLLFVSGRPAGGTATLSVGSGKDSTPSEGAMGSDGSPSAAKPAVSTTTAAAPNGSAVNQEDSCPVEVARAALRELRKEKSFDDGPSIRAAAELGLDQEAPVEERQLDRLLEKLNTLMTVAQDNTGPSPRLSLGRDSCPEEAPEATFEEDMESETQSPAFFRRRTRRLDSTHLCNMMEKIAKSVASGAVPENQLEEECENSDSDNPFHIHGREEDSKKESSDHMKDISAQHEKELEELRLANGRLERQMNELRSRAGDLFQGVSQEAGAEGLLQRLLQRDKEVQELQMGVEAMHRRQRQLEAEKRMLEYRNAQLQQQASAVALAYMCQAVAPVKVSGSGVKVPVTRVDSRTGTPTTSPRSATYATAVTQTRFGFVAPTPASPTRRSSGAWISAQARAYSPPPRDRTLSVSSAQGTSSRTPSAAPPAAAEAQAAMASLHLRPQQASIPAAPVATVPTAIPPASVLVTGPTQTRVIKATSVLPAGVAITAAEQPASAPSPEGAGGPPVVVHGVARDARGAPSLSISPPRRTSLPRCFVSPLLAAPSAPSTFQVVSPASSATAATATSGSVAATSAAGEAGSAAVTSATAAARPPPPPLTSPASPTPNTPAATTSHMDSPAVPLRGVSSPVQSVAPSPQQQARTMPGGWTSAPVPPAARSPRSNVIGSDSTTVSSSHHNVHGPLLTLCVAPPPQVHTASGAMPLSSSVRSSSSTSAHWPSSRAGSPERRWSVGAAQTVCIRAGPIIRKTRWETVQLATDRSPRRRCWSEMTPPRVYSHLVVGHKRSENSADMVAGDGLAEPVLAGQAGAVA